MHLLLLISYAFLYKHSQRLLILFPYQSVTVVCSISNLSSTKMSRKKTKLTVDGSVVSSCLCEWLFTRIS